MLCAKTHVAAISGQVEVLILNYYKSLTFMRRLVVFLFVIQSFNPEAHHFRTELYTFPNIKHNQKKYIYFINFIHIILKCLH